MNQFNKLIISCLSTSVFSLKMTANHKWTAFLKPISCKHMQFMVPQFTRTYFTDFYTLVTGAALVLKSKSLQN